MTDQTGKLFVIHKHRTDRTKSGKVRKLRRRRFYESNEVEEALGMARKHAAENNRDFLVVQIIAEASVPDKSEVPS